LRMVSKLRVKWWFFSPLVKIKIIYLYIMHTIHVQKICAKLRHEYHKTHRSTRVIFPYNRPLGPEWQSGESPRIFACALVYIRPRPFYIYGHCQPCNGVVSIWTFTALCIYIPSSNYANENELVLSGAKF